MNGLLLAASGEGEIDGLRLFLPADYDIIWSAITMLFIGVAFYKLILPKMNAILEERAQLIEEGIEKAATAQAEADELLDQQRQELAAARTEAAQIKDGARTEAGQIVSEAKGTASAEANRLLEVANRQIEAERQTASQSLKEEVGALATQLASKIVGESLEDEARQSRVVDRFLEELESATVSGSVKGQ